MEMSCYGATRYLVFSCLRLCDSISNFLFVFPLQKIEYMVVTFDNTDRNAKLSLRQSEILAKLEKIVEDIACGCEK